MPNDKRQEESEMNLITWEDVLAFKPCERIQEKYYQLFPLGSKLTIEEIINTMMKHNSHADAYWLIVRFMSHVEKVLYAIFAAEQVLGIYEKKYPEDGRPRKAIEAAKAWIKNPFEETKKAAYAADAAARAAAHAAYAAADAAADAVADAAAYAAADAADAAANKRLQEKILNFGIELIKRRMRESNADPK